MFRLKLVQGTDSAPGVRPEAHVPAGTPRFVIGRDPACDWPIPDRTLALSARHCEIVQTGGRAWLRDTSTNGTFVNGAGARLGGEHELRAGDRLALGPYRVEVQAAAPVAAAEPARGPAPAPARAAPVLPRRGGDPAAMLPEDWERAGGPAGGDDGADVRTGFTRIEKPPRRGPPAAAPSAAAGGTVEVAVPTPPARVAPRSGDPAATAATGPLAPAGPPAAHADAVVVTDADLVHHLAAGLGLPEAALGGLDPAVLARTAGRLLRAAIEALGMPPGPDTEVELLRLLRSGAGADGDARALQRALAEAVARRARGERGG